MGFFLRRNLWQKGCLRRTRHSVFGKGKEIPGQNFFSKWPPVTRTYALFHFRGPTVSKSADWKCHNGSTRSALIQRLLPNYFNGLKASHLFNGVLRKFLPTCFYIRVSWLNLKSKLGTSNVCSKWASQYFFLQTEKCNRLMDIRDK